MGRFQRRRVAATVTAIAGSATLLVALSGCGSAPRSAAGAAARGDDPAAASPSAGYRLNTPYALPAATLVDQTGQPFDVGARTRGRVSVVFFGFTHCKDICPTTMADITAAVHKLNPAQRAQVSVLFVTADPWRDTPARLKTWVGEFDPSFTGLTGTFAKIQAFAKACKVFVDAPADRTGDYEVQHGSQTLVFGRDQKAHELFTADPDSTALARDLGRILQG